jgi:hypothetical protein
LVHDSGTKADGADDSATIIGLSSFVVTRPYPESNVGSNLASMAGALWLAQCLGRTLIVDWLGQAQLRDKSLNYFAEFFATPSEILGVPVLYAPVSLGDYSESSSEARWVEPGEAHLLARGVIRADERFVVCQTYHGLDRLHHGPEPEQFRLLRSFYRAIRPAAEIDEAADRWWTENCDGAFVVGVNVRTGNGRWFGKGMPFAGRVNVSLFENPERLLRKLERACRARTRGLPRPLREDYLVFYATDSAAMSELLSRLPGARTRRGLFPPPGAGDLHAFEGRPGADRRAVTDTLVDMVLLARCDALVYNSSVFNQYARVLTGHFGGNVAHIELLFFRKKVAVALAAARRRLRAVRRRILRPRLSR